MFTRKAKIISSLIFVILVVIIFFETKKKSSKTTSDFSSSFETKRPPTLKKIASEPIKLRRVSAPRDENEGQTQDNFVIPTTIPKQCQDIDVLKGVIESDIENIMEKIQVPAEELDSCLLALGTPSQCFSKPKEADEDRTCTNNLIIARARLIDSFSDSKSIGDLDRSVLVNKILAKIYTNDKPMDEMGPEIFELADRLIDLENQNLEAHNLRSYFAVQAVKKIFDEKVLAKGRESAQFLSGTSDEKHYQSGLSYQFAYSMLGFISSNDSSNLEQAEFYAKEFLARAPKQARGYHMMATLEGYRGNLELCKVWTQRGIDVGGKQQPGYTDYIGIVQSIDDGTFKREYLGVRVDPSEAFNPENILGD